jgi:hypothetical protein
MAYQIRLDLFPFADGRFRDAKPHVASTWGC